MSVGYHNGVQQGNVLMNEISFSINSVANNDTETSMKKSSTNTVFYKCMHKDGISIDTPLESWIGIWNLCQIAMESRISYRNLVGVGSLTLRRVFVVAF